MKKSPIKRINRYLAAALIALGSGATTAADIKVNKSEWNSITAEQRAQIESILRNSGVAKATDKVVPDESTKAATATKSNPWCIAACDLGEGAAVAACTGSGPVVAVCIAAAHAAGEVCRSRC